MSLSRRRLVWAAAALLVLVTLSVGAAVVVQATAPEPVRVTEQELTVKVRPERTGEPVRLDVSVFTPAADALGADSDGRRAAVLLAHGFGGSKADLAGQARTLAREGYVVLTYTARGFGDSGGLIHLSAPDYEIADARAMLDLLAARDDVRLDSPGDPVVGIAGASYGGALALMAAGYDDRVDAIVPVITWHDLSQSLFPQYAVTGRDRDTGGDTPADVRPIDTPGVLKQRWAALLYGAGLAEGGTPGGSAEDDTPTPTAGDPTCGGFARRICTLYRDAASTGRPSQEVLDLLRRHSPAPVLDRIDAPTLLLQGQQDSLFPLGQADANARGIAATGTPVAVRWMDGGHDATGATATGTDTTGLALAWFDHHLRDGPDPGTDFTLTLPASPLEEDGPERRTAPAYRQTGTRAVPLGGEPQPIVSPPGGAPAAITSLPGTGSLPGAISGLGGAAYQLAALPGESAVFESRPVEEGFTVVGSPRVRLSVTSSTTNATLFVSTWVVSGSGGPEGTATLPRQLVSPVRLEGLTPGQPREIEVALPASAYEVEQGQRLRVLVSTTDAAYAVPDDQRTYLVGLDGQYQLRLPTVATEPAAGTASVVPRPLLAAVALLLLAALAVALWQRRRHRPPQLVDELREVPLAVSGLVKEYAGGLRAVDDVTWRAEQGQVVGLLGPNGAGKTTTMRMLVGLISADGGSIHVLGHEVAAGAPVLARVGALIEGPGFLPHLSGRENLEAFWAATGRPADEAGFDEALEIADLGAAADRVVRSYSHGMKQRLGIAQAMLGRPEVLLLDEPTNGLDPPQIRAMRGVLARYAEGGRTVVVSSHLLAEVEQTCSHVVVMHQGRVVLQGAVGDLVEQSGTTLVTVDGADPSRAATVLADVGGVSHAGVDDDGRVRVTGSAPRADLVAALVAAGVPVSAVDGRRHLEEVFMSLVGEETAAAPGAGSTAGEGAP